MTFSPEQTKLLSDKLDPKHVKPPQQFGPKGDYLEGWHVIAEANRVFGFDGWSYEVQALKPVSENPRKIGQQKKDGWGVTYTAKVRVIVSDVIREDCGAGHGYDVDLGMAHESAIKEAVTDALKRTLRTFGNVFGLALYDKSRANVGVDEPKPVSAAEMKRGLLSIDQELVDCRTVNEVNKLAAIWKDTATDQAWSKEYKIEAAKKFADKRDEIVTAEEDPEDIFPGDTPLTDDEVRQHPLNA